MKIIGIDPGLSGAIAILENNRVLSIFEMPVMSEGKKNWSFYLLLDRMEAFKLFRT